MSHIARITSSIAVVAVAGLVFSGCAASNASSGSTGTGTVTIGAPLALTGPAGSVGLDVQRGAELAIEEINSAGGLGGRQVSLDVQDTTGDPAQAVQVTTSFARDPNVLAIFGPINAAEVGAVTALGESNHIVIFPPASSGAVPGVDNGEFNPWTFRINEAIPLVVGPQMDAVLDTTGAEKVTILNYDDNAAYVNVGDRWAQAAEDAGATVQRLQFPTSTQDFSSTVSNIAPDTDLVAIGALSATDAQLVRAIRQAGIDAQIMGDASMLSSEVFTGSRGGSEGAYAYSAYLPDQSEESKAFAKAFTAKFDTDPTALNAYGYDAIKMIAHAVGDGDVTRESVQKGLSTLTEYPGATGVISYDVSGDAIRESVPLVQIGSDGGLTQVSEITPKESQ